MMRAVWVAMSNVYFVRPLVSSVNSWYSVVLLWRSEYLWCAAESCCLGRLKGGSHCSAQLWQASKLKCWLGGGEVVGVQRQSLPVRVCHCKLLSSWSVFSVEYHCWEWILQSKVGNIWNATFVSFSICQLRAHWCTDPAFGWDCF